MVELFQQALSKRAFYKYTTAETACAILATKTVRYSSPHAFNDPFDIQSGLHFDFDLSTLHEKVLRRIQDLASGLEEPAVDPNDPWGQSVLLTRQMYKEHGFPWDRWMHTTKPSLEGLLQVIRQTRDSYEAYWRDFLVPSIRVFCVSEERDNLLMWAHYAKDHTGAVFEFWSLPEEDNPLSVALPVSYVKHPPPFFTEQEWIDDLVTVRRLDVQALSRRYAYAKSEHWAYEREWRVWYPLSDPLGMYDMVPVRPSELRAVYLGCRINPMRRAELLDTLRNNFPETMAYQATKSEGAYTLCYKEI